MNLRIDKDSLRFRLSRSELVSLCENGCVQQVTYLPNNQVVKIAIKIQEMVKQPLMLDMNGGEVILLADSGVMQDLLIALPKREGVECQQIIGKDDYLNIMLDVDVRTQRRSANK